MFKRIQKIIFIEIFIALILLPMLSWGVISIIDSKNNSIMKSLDFDLNEKRNKATLSEVFDATKFTSEVENYYNDRLPYRSILITFKRYLDAKIELPYKNHIEKPLIKLFSKKKLVEDAEEEISISSERFMDDAVDKFLGHGLYKDEIDPYDNEIEFPIRYLNDPKVIMGQSDWLYLNENNISYYQGLNVIASDSEIKKYIAPYLRLKNMCDRVGKRLIILICPEKEEIYPEYMPTLEIKNEREKPYYISEYIKNNTDLIYIYPKDEMLQYKKNYLLYKKYDSHWNAIGGYIAANEIKKKLGCNIIPLRDLKLKKVKTLDADLAFYGNTSAESLPLTFKYEVLNYKTDHFVDFIFINNQITYDSFTTHCNKGFKRKVFLLGDSFREAMQDYFVKDFEEFYCNTYLNMHEKFIREEAKRADDIIISLVERNEEIVLPQICELLYGILGEYENELRTLFK